MLTLLLAQAAEGTKIEITLPIAITVAGVAGLVYTLVQLGDRLWGKKNGRSSPQLLPTPDLAKSVDSLGSICTHNQDRIVDTLTRLSEAMTKYIELQQATLKIEEMRHGAIVDAIRAIDGRITDIERNRTREIQAIRDDLTKLARDINGQ